MTTRCKALVLGSFQCCTLQKLTNNPLECVLKCQCNDCKRKGSYPICIYVILPLTGYLQNLLIRKVVPYQKVFFPTHCGIFFREKTLQLLTQLKLPIFPLNRHFSQDPWNFATLSKSKQTQETKLFLHVRTSQQPYIIKYHFLFCQINPHPLPTKDTAFVGLISIIYFLCLWVPSLDILISKFISTILRNLSSKNALSFDKQMHKTKIEPEFSKPVL